MQTDARTSWREAVLIGLALVVGRLALVGQVPVGETGLLDWIGARHHAAGIGVVWTVGRDLPFGTAPGWSLLLAWTEGLFGGIPRAAVTLSITCEVGVALLLLRMMGRDALLPLVLLVLWPRAAADVVTGSEGPLIVLAVGGALWTGLRGRPVLAGLLLGVATGLRPEVLLAVPAVLDRLRRQPFRWLLPATILGSFALPILGGDLELHAIARVLASEPGPVAEPPWRSLLGPDPLSSLICLTGAVGIVLAWAKVASRVGLRPLLLLLPLGVLPVWSGDDPGLYVFRLAACWGTGALLARQLRRVSISQRVLAPTLAVSVAALLVLARPLRQPGPSWEPFVGWAEASGWGAGLGTLYTHDPVWPSWYGGGEVIDASGALSGTRSPSDSAAVERTEPDFLLLSASVDGVRWLRASDELARRYYPVLRFGSSPEPELEPDLEDLPPTTEDDWLLLRRRL